MDADANLEADFIFSIFDTDRDGHLSRDEFKGVFQFLSRDQGHSSTAYIDDVMAQVDADGDGNITKDEYRRWMQKFMRS